MLGLALQRREAISLFREICDSISDESLISSVSLNPCVKTASYELRIRTVFDKSAVKAIRSIVEKHELSMDELKGCIVIYSPKAAQANPWLTA